MLINNLKDYKIILASQSPRRKALLKGLDLTYETRLIPDIDETFPDSMAGSEVPLFLAKRKAQAYKLNKNEILLTADTVVLLEDKILNKPQDEQDARQMLESLSGKKHEVVTGVCLTSTEKQKAFSCSSFVFFKTLSAEEIDYYLINYKPFDKAGAYGIQEWIGFAAIDRIEGSYFNIMGLPVHLVYTELTRFIQ
jgi:septum formation protein